MPHGIASGKLISTSSNRIPSNLGHLLMQNSQFSKPRISSHICILNSNDLYNSVKKLLNRDTICKLLSYIQHSINERIIVSIMSVQLKLEIIHTLQIQKKPLVQFHKIWSPKLKKISVEQIGNEKKNCAERISILNAVRESVQQLVWSCTHVCLESTEGYKLRIQNVCMVGVPFELQ